MHLGTDPLGQLRFRLSGSCGKARCEPGWDWRAPALADYDLWYVVSGRGTMLAGGRRFGLAKGSCFLLRPGDKPIAEQDPADRLTVMYIHFEALQDGRLYKERLPIARYTEVDEPVWFESLLNRMLVCSELADDLAAGEFDGLLRLALFALMRQQAQYGETGDLSAKQRRTVAKVCAAIRGSAAGNMTVADAAELSGLSAEYLSRLFKNVTGGSLQAYLTKTRMERAMLLLTETSMNVSQIADALGYANVFGFSRQFKRYFGEPPSHCQFRSVAARPHGRARRDEPVSGKG
ncbi:helix-turn-helix transcriptional regulator [Paenibacillus humicola]|uniref:helix-turn-helix transcriptional regulator n=1 Tax=Paenibacillus humicola TaxID=3110540 RepID=UPI00237A12EF|nr:AraC family transcriptional regulator [Paenibacillus humicola]